MVAAEVLTVVFAVVLTEILAEAVAGRLGYRL